MHQELIIQKLGQELNSIINNGKLQIEMKFPILQNCLFAYFLCVMIFLISHNTASSINLLSKYKSYQLMRKNKVR
jgi:hypothetical protein